MMLMVIRSFQEGKPCLHIYPGVLSLGRILSESDPDCLYAVLILSPDTRVF